MRFKKQTLNDNRTAAIKELKIVQQRSNLFLHNLYKILHKLNKNPLSDQIV